MNDNAATSLTPEHRDFFERFKSFWAAPTGSRVAELIAPDATIHFTGAGTFSGAEYVDIMQGMLDAMVDMRVTPLDCAGNGDRPAHPLRGSRDDDALAREQAGHGVISPAQPTLVSA